MNRSYTEERKVLFVYWIQFLIFIISQFKRFSIFEGSASIFYFSFYFLFLFNKQKEKKSSIFLIFMGLIFFLLGVAFNSYFSHFLMFYLFFYLLNRKAVIEDKKLLMILNRSTLICAVFGILFNHSLKSQYMIYSFREIPNKFLPFFNRFIGVEGTPAGMDILIIIFIFMNIFYGERNIYRYLKLFFGFFFLVWTSSFSNLVAVILAAPVIKIKKLKIIYICITTFFFHKIITYMYIYSNEKIKLILNRLTTFRAFIWTKILENYDNFLGIKEKILGSRYLVEFEFGGNKFTQDPHNTFLLLEQKLGYVSLIIIYIYILYKIRRMEDKKKIFLILIILIYATTNSTILSPRGNPIIIYTLFFLLQSNKKIRRKL